MITVTIFNDKIERKKNEGFKDSLPVALNSLDWKVLKSKAIENDEKIYCCFRKQLLSPKVI